MMRYKKLNQLAYNRFNMENKFLPRTVNAGLRKEKSVF